MAMQTKDIYDHHRKHVGKIEIYRKTAKAHVFFKHETHYANRTLELEEIEEYMNNFGFMFEEDLDQLTLEDLL